LQTTAFIELFQEAVGHSRLKLQMTLLQLQFCDVQCDAVVMHQAIKEVNYGIFIPVPTSTKIILKITQEMPENKMAHFYGSLCICCCALMSVPGMWFYGIYALTGPSMLCSKCYVISNTPLSDNIIILM